MKNEEERKGIPDEGGQEMPEKRKQSSAARAAKIDAIISSPTDAARSHRHTDSLGNQGTNISYEGPSAPGGGGSAGTGYASGQDAVGARISTTDANEQISEQSEAHKQKGEDLMKPHKENDELDRDTLGTP